MPGFLIKFKPWYKVDEPSLVTINDKAFAISIMLPPPMPMIPLGNPFVEIISSRNVSINSVVGSYGSTSIK